MVYNQTYKKSAYLVNNFFTSREIYVSPKYLDMLTKVGEMEDGVQHGAEENHPSRHLV